MRTAIALAISLGFAAASPAVAASAAPSEPTPHHNHRRHHHHAGARPAPSALVPAPTTPLDPAFKPFPPGQGDSDGLSRDPDDCDKGCIGGNPG